MYYYKSGGKEGNPDCSEVRWYVFEMKGKKGKKVTQPGDKVEERIE